MYFKSILPTVALFFLAASSANAAPREPKGPNQILARSPHLLIRQATGDYGDCNNICVPAETKAYACGNSEACVCGPAVFGPFLDCGKCVYKQTTTASLRNEMEDAVQEYVDGCKDAGQPIQGDTSLTGSPSVQVSSSSAGSSASASATAGSSSATNGATGAVSRSAAGLALPVVFVAVFGFLV